MGSNTVQLTIVSLLVSLFLFSPVAAQSTPSPSLQNVEFTNGLDSWNVYNNDGTISHAGGEVIMTFTGGSTAPLISQSFVADSTAYQIAVEYQIIDGSGITISAAGSTNTKNVAVNALSGGTLSVYIHPNVADIVTLDISVSRLSGGNVSIDKVWVITENVPTPTPLPTATPDYLSTPDLNRMASDNFAVIDAIPTAVDTSNYDIFQITDTEPMTMAISFTYDDAETLFSHMRGVTGWFGRIPYIFYFVYGFLTLASLRLIVAVVRRSLRGGASTSNTENLPRSITE